MSEPKPIYAQRMSRTNEWQRVVGPEGETIGYVHHIKGGWKACDASKRVYERWTEGDERKPYDNPTDARDQVGDEWVTGA